MVSAGCRRVALPPPAAAGRSGRGAGRVAAPGRARAVAGSAAPLCATPSPR